MVSINLASSLFSSVLEMCTENCLNADSCDSMKETIKCACKPGYTGAYCDVNINDCSPNPCAHGQCVDSVNGYQCRCDSGYWDKNCDKEVEVAKGMNNMTQSNTNADRYNVYYLMVFNILSSDVPIVTKLRREEYHTVFVHF